MGNAEAEELEAAYSSDIRPSLDNVKVDLSRTGPSPSPARSAVARTQAE